MIRKTAKIMAYNGLVSALNTGIVKLQINPEKYNMPGAPVYMPWLWLAPIIVFTMAAVIFLLAFGLLVGLVWTISILTVGAFWYQKSYTMFARGKIYEIIVQRAKSGLDTFEKIWNYGGARIVIIRDRQIGIQAPTGDWEAFVALNFPNLMKSAENLPSPNAPLPNEAKEVNDA